MNFYMQEEEKRLPNNGGDDKGEQAAQGPVR